MEYFTYKSFKPKDFSGFYPQPDDSKRSENKKIRKFGTGTAESPCPSKTNSN